MKDSAGGVGPVIFDGLCAGSDLDEAGVSESGDTSQKSLTGASSYR